ncbi:MAG: glutamine--fructose-6-phosphate transaminase (isomerizing) [SAR324 cluster bacterium]|nr:glutamine--fructose-6-phosphate transaminase (isomerizing) [SAR324 cluster bacterium]
MCGISGMINAKNVAHPLYASIRNLEYRGYDSCGMALLDVGKIQTRKNTGGVEEVNQRERLTQLSGRLGIAHTRWATHGVVSRANAHPHLSTNEAFAVVHNGIFSNYQDLREELEVEGVPFCSQTDTEVFVQLLARHYERLQNTEHAFVAALEQMEGSFAIVMISVHEPDRLFCAKRDSPLILGLGEDSNYVGSDINAFLEYTRRAVILDDDEYVILTQESYQIRSLRDGQQVEEDILHIDWDAETTRKGGFAHYMLKEIFDEPQTLRQALKIPDEEIRKLAQKFVEAPQVYLVGVGTTFYVAQLGQYFFSQLTGRYFPAISSDEFIDIAGVQAQDLVLAVSQSGETYDTKMALNFARQRGAKTAAIVNVMGSSIGMQVGQVIMQGSGPEICVVSTKAAMAQTLILLRTAVETGRQQGTLDNQQVDSFLVAADRLPDLIQDTLNEQSGFLRNVARSTSWVPNWLFLGCGQYYPVAMESALKMKEVTYQHAEGMPAGFLKHGTLSMIEKSVHSLFFVPLPDQQDLHRRTLIAMEEIRTRGGTLAGFVFEGDRHAREVLDYAVELPTVHPWLAPLLQMTMAQLLSYYAALDLGRNIDKPRNLAKSVTVG